MIEDVISNVLMDKFCQGTEIGKGERKAVEVKNSSSARCKVRWLFLKYRRQKAPLTGLFANAFYR